ncbi:hypothetical protein MPLB_1040011 [Mesorhizobium sp. ORS 3324]|nr:hypothetical protein MPLB_1040011 [Mesorhizobium sp. ORS 3324]
MIGHGRNAKMLTRLKLGPEADRLLLISRCAEQTFISAQALSRSAPKRAIPVTPRPISGPIKRAEAWICW